MANDVRSDQVERLLSVQRAARAVADSAAFWWRHLAEAADAAITTDTLDAFYRLLLTAMQPVFGADEVSILVADPAAQALVARTSLGLGEDTTVPVRIPVGEGMAGRVLGTKQPLVVDDLSTITLVSPTLQDRGLRSVVAVPILADDRILGVMHAGSRELAHFSADDAELLGILAERVAIAVERVRLIEDQRHVAQVSTFLAETARIMAGATDLTSTLDELAKAALPAIGDLCIIDMVTDSGQIDRVVARHVDPAKQPLADRLQRDFAPGASSNHPAAEVLRMGGSRWSPTTSENFLRATTHNEDHLQLTRTLGFRSYVVVPISTTTQKIGALTLVSCSRSFGQDDVTLAESLAQQVGSVIAKAQQLDQASLTSRLLQEALLPAELPVIPGLVVQTSYSAALHALDVGGDFYDLVPLPDGGALITVGDVEGHDQRAAAEMGQLRSAIRTLAIRGQPPEQVVDELRQSWELLGFTRTATVVVGRIDCTTGELVLASAGHPPPLLISASTADYVPVPANALLGMHIPRPATPYATSLPRGDVLLLYTDGALQERTYHIDKAMGVLRELALEADRSPRAICRRVIDEVHDGDDDTALLAVMRT
jgi:GAF domain-containing protein